MTAAAFDEQAFAQALAANDLPAAQRLLAEADAGDVIDHLDRLPAGDRAIAFRLLPKDEAVTVFDRLDAASQTTASTCSMSCRPWWRPA